MAIQHIVLVFTVLGSVVAHKDYSGYQVLTIKPVTQYAVDDVEAIISQYQLDVWKTPSLLGQGYDVMISPRDIHDVSTALQTEGIDYVIMVSDVGTLMEDSLPLEMSSDLNTSRFYNLSEIHAFLEEQALVCGSDCQIFDIGSSYEGRPLKVIKIGRSGSARRAIWCDGGIHAREWLTPAVNTFFVDKLINDDGIDPDVTLLRDAYDWYIHPVVNPDGYEYTWTTDRMWRKTRSPNNDACIGTDPNRNYGFQWGGGDNNTCGETYQGAYAESESEISSFTSFLSSIGASVDLSMNYHTYGEILLLPWAYTTTDPVDLPDIENLASICIDAINANSTLVYEYGQVSGPTGGMSLDYPKGALNVKYSYLMEMRGEGTYGFIAPPSEILPTSLEQWAGLSAMAKDIMTIRN